MRQLILAIALIALSGCGPVDAPNTIPGHYELKSRDVNVSLEVRADGTYTETVKYRTNGEENNSNRWKWAVNQVIFNDILLPEIDRLGPEHFFGPETAKRLNAHKTVQGTIQLDWSMAAEKVFGDIRLAPYPDNDLFFHKTGQQ